MLKSKYYILSFIIVLLAASSCSTTRRIDSDEMLYTGVKSIIYPKNDSTESSVKSVVSEAVNVKPTNTLSPLLSEYLSDSGCITTGTRTQAE